MQERNLVREAMLKKLATADASGLAQRAEDMCRSNFTLFHALNYVAYTEALDAFDLIEEEGLMRQEVKKHKNACLKDWNRYYNELHRSLKANAWYFLQDWLMSTHNLVEHDLNTARYTAANALLKHRCERSSIIASLTVSLFILGLYNYMWRTYFKAYGIASGLDLSVDYTWARIDQFFFHLDAIKKELEKVNKGKEFSFLDEKDYVSAVGILEAKFSGRTGNILDQSARIALTYGGYIDENGQVIKKVLQ